MWSTEIMKKFPIQKGIYLLTTSTSTMGSRTPRQKNLVDLEGQPSAVHPSFGIVRIDQVYDRHEMFNVDDDNVMA
jgi:hypothetical protein